MGASMMLVLLPPSEGKELAGDARKPWGPESGVFGRRLDARRAEVARRLAAVKGGDAALLGVKGAHLDRARHANSHLLGAPSLPAWRRYTGVVWDHLDLSSLSAEARKEATKRILVPSGLAGLVRADDPLPDYRLKMGARLAPFGAMSAWWRPDLTDALAAFARGRAVVDLLPQEHRGAIIAERIPGLVRVNLVSKSGGVVGGHNAKAAKGLLARHLLASRGPSLARRVSSFRHDEYEAVIDG